MKAKFASFPKTQPPPDFVKTLIAVFRAHEATISTVRLAKGLESDDFLRDMASDLKKLGFDIEDTKKSKISRPVFFGEDGEPSLLYEIDGYQKQWKCGLEIEAGRSILGNAVFRDLFQAMVMTDVAHLCIAVPIIYKYKSNGRALEIKCYDKARSIADALYGHTRMAMPYGLTIIGY